MIFAENHSWPSMQSDILMSEFYSGDLKYENLGKAERELIDIQKRLKKFEPSKVFGTKPTWIKGTHGQTIVDQTSLIY